MDAKTLIAALLDQRDSWCELAPALKVKLRRPPEEELGQFYGGVTAAAVKKYAVDWSGFTEAELLGAAVGSSSLLPFSADVWAVVVGDKAEWLELCAQHLVQQITAHLNAKAATAKNSPPSSTPKAKK
jgi:hypothetical protein